MPTKKQLRGRTLEQWHRTTPEPKVPTHVPWDRASRKAATALQGSSYSVLVKIRNASNLDPGTTHVNVRATSKEAAMAKVAARGAKKGHRVISASKGRR